MPNINEEDQKPITNKLGHPYLEKVKYISNPRNQKKNQYVPKFVRDNEKFERGQQKRLQKYNWRKDDGDDLMTVFLQKVLEKFDGDKDKTYAHIEEMKKNGTLQQILSAQNFNLKEMITDRNQFIN